MKSWAWWVMCLCGGLAGWAIAGLHLAPAAGQAAAPPPPHWKLYSAQAADSDGKLERLVFRLDEQSGRVWKYQSRNVEYGRNVAVVTGWIEIFDWAQEAKATEESLKNVPGWENLPHNLPPLGQ